MIAVPSQALTATIGERVAAASAARYGKGLRAVVLTGSLARDEVAAREDQGRRRLLGDAEFLLVFDETVRLPEAGDVERLRRQVEDALAQCGVEGRLSFGSVHPVYLARLTPRIFAYELKACGQVVWGDHDVLSLIPNFSAADIPLEDAWRLLCNRMIEQLEIVQDLADPGAALRSCVPYPTIKLYLDMATSYLLFAGAYEPSYRARAQAVRRLAGADDENGSTPFPLAEFARRVTACTEAKLSGLGGEALALQTDEDRLDFWRASLTDAHALWRWELRRLTHMDAHASDRALWERWMGSQPVAEKVRGWLSMLRRVDRLGGWRDRARWVCRAWRGSPRYWVYAAASELCFRLPSVIPPGRTTDAEADWEEVFGLLPARQPETRAATRLRWQALASDVLWNYHRFLTETRA
jgi:hypothetical protein